MEQVVVPAANNARDEQPQPPQPELQPYPFYYYIDHSQKPDPDSLTPLTPPGRVPSFVAKMHAILSRDRFGGNHSVAAARAQLEGA